MLATIGACGGGGGASSSGSDDCPSEVTYATTAKPFVQKYCISCHSKSVSGTARDGAPVGINFDDEKGLRAHGTHVHEYTDNGRMPPTDDLSLPQPSAFERDAFVEWTVCSGVAGEHTH
jgi:uncharacterized membrane protein